jgi:4a-hydroxytetrahydrobiopterin dehydratase
LLHTQEVGGSKPSAPTTSPHVALSASRQPDIDLRAKGVTVRLQRDESGELTEADLALAGTILSKASELGATVDLTGLQSYQVAIDAVVIPDVLPFWETVFGYERFGDALIDPHSEGPTFWFQQMDDPRPQRNRIHIDLYVPEAGLRHWQAPHPDRTPRALS